MSDRMGGGDRDRHAAGHSSRVLAAAFAGLLVLMPAARALAHGEGSAEATSAAGEAVVAGKATRTVTVSTTDAMRFQPGSLRFVRGDVVRLRIVNAGKLPHEFVLGTPAEIAEHAAMMRRMPDMRHEDANAVRVAPGRTGEIVWRFSRTGKFAYACLIPGHLEAGMRGSIEVVARGETPASRK